DGAAYLHVMGCSLMADAALAGRIIETGGLVGAGGGESTVGPNSRPGGRGGADVAAMVAPILERGAILLPGAAELRLLAGVEDLDDAAGGLVGRYPSRGA